MGSAYSWRQRGGDQPHLLTGCVRRQNRRHAAKDHQDHAAEDHRLVTRAFCNCTAGRAIVGRAGHKTFRMIQQVCMTIQTRLQKRVVARIRAVHGGDMKHILWAIVAILSPGGTAAAQEVDAVVAAAGRAFDQMPQVIAVDQIAGQCGATPAVNQTAVYCTSENTIFVTAGVTGLSGAYQVAHLYGHAVQVRHGVADVALRTIRGNRDEEAALRRDVTRMVECIAGVILKNGAVPRPDLTVLFSTEPFTGSHWGRRPLDIGPQVTLGLLDRNRWLQRGFDAGHPQVCDTEAFPADLVVDAFRP